MPKGAIGRRIAGILGDGRAVTRIGPRLRIRGEMEGADHFYIEGRVEGNLRTEGTAYVAVGGSVLGDVHAAKVVIDGTVEGNVTGTDSAQVRSSGRLLGDLRTPRPKISEGAYFQGQILRGDGEE